MIRMLGKSGNVAIMTAMLAIPMIGFVGLAVDGARVWLLQSRLYSALDASAMSLARNIAMEQRRRDADAEAIFWANFVYVDGRNSNITPAPVHNRTGFLRSGVQFGTPVIDTVQGVVTVSAEATIPTTFGRVLGIQILTARASAQARRSDVGLELALVLDVTASMDTSCPSPSDRGALGCRVTTIPRQPGQGITGVATNNLDVLRVAAADLVNTLYGDRETVPDLWVSVVPFTSAVNLGREEWLDAESRRTLDADFWPARWRGCVEIRSGGYPGAPANGNLTDTPPNVAPFRRFFYPSTLNDYTLVQRVTRSGREAVERQPLAGDNDWSRTMWTAFTPRENQNAITEDYQLWRGNQNVGPNLGCSESRMLPLTSSKTTVLDTIQNLRPSFRGGTMAISGLQAGWFALSPRWRGAWNLQESTPRQATSLPLDYNVSNMRKAIVLMTDGATNWNDTNDGLPGQCGNRTVNLSSFPSFGSGNAPGTVPQALQPRACPPAGTPVCPPAGSGTPAPNPCIEVRPGAPPLGQFNAGGNGVINADYTGFGRRAENRATPAQLDQRLAQLCTDIKRQNIEIYTMVVDTTGVVPSATQRLYQNCATDPNTHYFLVTRADQLTNVFQQIGARLGNLRLVQ